MIPAAGPFPNRIMHDGNLPGHRMMRLPPGVPQGLDQALVHERFPPRIDSDRRSRLRGSQSGDRSLPPAGNRRDLQALGSVPRPGECRQRMRRLAEPVRTDRRSHRGLNPAREADVNLMTAVLHGEHTLRGFTNADVRGRLYGDTNESDQRRRDAPRTGRQLKLLHANGLIARIPRTRRWRITADGWTIMSTILMHYHEYYPNSAAQAA